MGPLKTGARRDLSGVFKRGATVSEVRFKRLTNQNFLELDPVMANFVFVSKTTGAAQNPTAGEWTSRFLGPTLSKGVPVEVIELVEGARGAMIYGCFFYPLYAIGEAHLFLAAEAALRARLQGTIGIDLRRRRFHGLLGLALNKAVIANDRMGWWEAMESLRNSAVHPDFQQLGPPGQSLGLLAGTCREISRLFDSAPHATRI